MSIVSMVETISEIVETAIREARDEALGLGPGPDAEKTTYRIFDELWQAVQSDVALQEEVLAAIPPR